MIAIFANPLDFYDAMPYLPSGTEFSNPLTHPDGRCAMSNEWTALDAAYLVASGAVMYATLPEDWQYPVSRYGGD